MTADLIANLQIVSSYMKKNFIGLMCLLNLFYFLSWISTYNLYRDQIERQKHFLKNWLIFEDIFTLNVVLLILTIVSTVLIVTDKNLSKYIKLPCLIIHVCYVMFIIWSSL